MSSPATAQLKPKLSLLIGAPKTGKTTAIQSLIRAQHELEPFAFGRTFVRTGANHGLDWLPNNTIAEDGYAGLMEYIETLQAKTKHPTDIFAHIDLQPNFIILEDAGGLFMWDDHKLSRWLSTYRHHNTWVYISLQRCVDRKLAPGIMTLYACAEDVYIYRLGSLAGREICAKSFSSTQLPSKEAFNSAYDAAVNIPYTALVFDTTTHSHSTWKAEPIS